MTLHQVNCEQCGNRYLDLNGPEEMCSNCRVVPDSAVPLWRPEGRSEPDHTRINCPLPNICFWHRPPHPGLSGRLSHERHEDKLGGFGVFQRHLPRTAMDEYLKSVERTIAKAVADADKPLVAAIGVVLGAASSCWTNLEGAGTFESDRAAGLITVLEKWVIENKDRL